MTARDVTSGDSGSVEPNVEKAAQFLRCARVAYRRADYDAAYANAVHCGIAASDSLRAGKGERDRDGQHRDAPPALRRLGFDRASELLSKLLQHKSKAEYLPERISQGEAHTALGQANGVFAVAWNETGDGTDRETYLDEPDPRV